SLTENRHLAKQNNDVSVDYLNVWVLGASIGGPEAVKRFLSRVPKELPVAFVLAQHLGDGFISLLADQLDKISSFHVKEGISGDTLKHGEVVVVPVDNCMSLDEKGQIKLIDDDWKGHYKPSIDSVIDDVTSSFKQRSGVIIFSGMGADGVLASQQFAEKYKGNIWAQNSESCVISSMPDSVRKADLVSYSGSPEALALKIAVYYMGKESYII
ncbi:MAG: chemotaxis protein CheB, partial [Gammaproteobacteria bacterium]|nr:chemotaxis protein CheB [Gammaproteobacteria bacterium]